MFVFNLNTNRKWDTLYDTLDPSTNIFINPSTSSLDIIDFGDYNDLQFETTGFSVTVSYE